MGPVLSRVQLSKVGSSTRTSMPPASQVARPMPIESMPRVTMNEGMRSLVWMTPLTKAHQRGDADRDQHAQLSPDHAFA